MENTVQQIATATSSENSVSIDGSNTEEEQPDDDSSTSQKSAIDIENGSDCGAPPCKQARNKECDIKGTSLWVCNDPQHKYVYFQKKAKIKFI